MACLLLQLRRRLYWAIAGVLAAYWSREVLSMLIASPYASPLTLKMVAISSLYHVGKIILISLDAQRRWSPTMGIMRLLMDHWHMSSFKDALLCVKRMSLQVENRRAFQNIPPAPAPKIPDMTFEIRRPALQPVFPTD